MERRGRRRKNTVADSVGVADAVVADAVSESSEPESGAATVEGGNYHVEFIPIGDLTPYEKNAKKHPKEQVERIKASIREFGFRQNLVVDENNVVVIGHGRLQAAKELGTFEALPCIRANDLTPDQIKALRLADNKVAESDWNDDFLNFELDTIDLDMTQFGFDFSEDGDEPKEDGEVPFTEELLLTHNYIVLYFDNDFDWEVAQDRFKLKKVKDLIPRKGQPTGIGRVIDGKEVLKWLS